MLFYVELPLSLLMDLQVLMAGFVFYLFSHIFVFLRMVEDSQYLLFLVLCE